MSEQTKVAPLAIKGVAQIVAVASGKGGVGKSTIATNLAVALKAAGRRVGLLDADIYGPSQGTLFGLASGTKPEVVDQLLVPILAHGVYCMSMPAARCGSWHRHSKSRWAWLGAMMR